MVCIVVRNFSKGALRTFGVLFLNMLLCLSVFIPLVVREVRASPGIGYWIIITGTLSLGDQGWIDNGSNDVFRTLLRIGYNKDRVYYLSPSFQDIDDDDIDDRDNWSSAASLQYAIETWASARVSASEPLFLYMWDHGGYEVFCIRNDTGDFSVHSDQLELWLNSLPGDVPKYVIYAACHSGSFINELSAIGRIVITTCREEENSLFSWNGEDFSYCFFELIERRSYSIQRAFNHAYDYALRMSYSGDDLQYHQHALLDDNGDDVGHSGPLPNGGDGDFAGTRLVGTPLFMPVRILRVAAVSTIKWPPVANVALWAEVKDYEYVRAWMQRPNWYPGSGHDDLIPLELEEFIMTDTDGDDIFTVELPPTTFDSGSGLYKFIITAEQTGGAETEIPLITGVQFTTSGEPPLDITNPTVEITRPSENSAVSGPIHIQGIASDNVCLDKVALYINDYYQGDIVLSPTSNSFFDFTFDTGTLSGPTATLTVKAYDTSGKMGMESIKVKLGMPVGGVVIPVDKFGLLAPYIGLALTIIVATVATAFYAKPRKEKQ